MQTLLELKSAGLTYVLARCVECKIVFEVPVSALQLPELTILSDICALRPIACPNCSAPALILPLDLPTKAEVAGSLAGARNKDEGAK